MLDQNTQQVCVFWYFYVWNNQVGNVGCKTITCLFYLHYEHTSKNLFFIVATYTCTLNIKQEKVDTFALGGLLSKIYLMIVHRHLIILKPLTLCWKEHLCDFIKTKP